MIPSQEDFIPITPDNDVVSEQVPPYFRNEDLEKVVSWPFSDNTISAPAVLIARFGIRTWGHWLGELLPKLVLVESSYPGKFKYVLPQEVVELPGFKTTVSSLQTYQIGKDRLILLPPGRYRFERLHCVSSVWSRGKMHPEAANAMHLERSRSSRNSPGKVALLRTESSTRNVSNLDEIRNLLVRHGFQMFELENNTFPNQMQLFEDADCIVSILGSSLAGLLYARRNVRIATLSPADWSDLFFFALMQLCDASLADIRGTSVPADPRTPGRAAFCVSTNELEHGLASLV